jgi:hypothetical protein
MIVVALTLFAQLVVVGGDPAACKAKKAKTMEVRPSGAMTVRELLEIMSRNDCVRYLVPAHLLDLRLNFSSSMQFVKDWRGPVASALEDLGLKVRDETVLRIDGPPPPPPLGEADYARGIHCDSPGHCTIERKLLERVLEESSSLAMSARIVPSIHDGKPDGFKLYAIRPGSFFAHLGFENGDTIQTINGMDMSSPERALELYTKIRNATNIAVRIVRRGEPKTLEFTIR